ncbi:MAG: hypothetical protein V6Z81_09070 [Parvularculales bacterium]
MALFLAEMTVFLLEAVKVIAIIAPVLLVLLFFSKLSRYMADDLQGQNMRRALSQKLKSMLKYAKYAVWACSVLLFYLVYDKIEENPLLVFFLFWILFWWGVLYFPWLDQFEEWRQKKYKQRRRKRREGGKMSNNSLWEAAGKVMVRVSRVLLLVLISFPLFFIFQNIERKGAFEGFVDALFGTEGGFLVFFILFISGLNYILFDQFYPWAEYKEDDMDIER